MVNVIGGGLKFQVPFLYVTIRLSDGDDSWKTGGPVGCRRQWGCLGGHGGVEWRGSNVYSGFEDSYRDRLVKSG